MKTLIASLPVLIIALAIPLLLRRVPPNVIYGFRTPKTMASPQVWYEANHKLGVNLLVAGVLTLVVWCVLAAVSGVRRAGLVFPSVFLVSLAGSVIVSFVQLQRL